MLGCLLALLLTSGKVVEIAERQEFGDARDRNLAVAEGIDRGQFLVVEPALRRTPRPT